MGILGRVKEWSTALTVQKPRAIERIPPFRTRLLFVSHEMPRAHAHGLQISISLSVDGVTDAATVEPDDPSTIYTKLSVREADPDDVIAGLSYFPSYSGMLAEQRWVYLTWLMNTSNPIDVGYVFTYYYGLERHLVYGDFDGAFDEIKILRRHQKNASFQTYSASALVHACLLRKRPDKLKDLYLEGDFDYFGNSNLLLLYQQKIDLSVEVMLRLANILSGVNKRYLKSDINIYRDVLIETLEQSFGAASYPFCSRFAIDDIAGISYPTFANISLPSSIRTPNLPNFLHHRPFQEELGLFFRQVHEVVKLKKKQSKSNVVKRLERE
jgi:hypothetical protein